MANTQKELYRGTMDPIDDAEVIGDVTQRTDNQNQPHVHQVDNQSAYGRLPTFDDYNEDQEENIGRASMSNYITPNQPSFPDHTEENHEKNHNIEFSKPDNIEQSSHEHPNEIMKDPIPQKETEAPKQLKWWQKLSNWIKKNILNKTPSNGKSESKQTPSNDENESKQTSQHSEDKSGQPYDDIIAQRAGIHNSIKKTHNHPNRPNHHWQEKIEGEKNDHKQHEIKK